MNRRPDRRTARQRRTTTAVVVLSAVLVLACVGWAVLVQHLTPNACEVSPRPARSQYLHC